MALTYAKAGVDIDTENRAIRGTATAVPLVVIL